MSCPICEIDPLSHSFTKVMETDEYVLYNTCPSKSKLYYDTEGIIQHYESVLSQLGKKKWIWVFDSIGFNLQHFLQFDLAIQMTKLISKYSDQLLQIIVLNPTIYIRSTYTMIYPFLNDKLKSMIII
jgi:hypothetical protein